MAKLSFGIEDTAMPPFAEWMPFNERWALVKYTVDTFQTGVQGGESTMNRSELPADYVTYDNGIYEEEGNTIDVGAGKQIYRCLRHLPRRGRAGRRAGVQGEHQPGPRPVARQARGELRRMARVGRHRRHPDAGLRRPLRQ